MQSGQLCLVNYGEVPVCWHTRLLLSPIDGSTWQILTPDHDRYPEQMDQHNPDFVGFEFLGHSAAIPAHIPARQVYGFSPMTPAELAQHQHFVRIEADAERAARGLPPRGGVAPAVPVPNPPVAPAAPGVLGAAAAPVAEPAPVAAAAVAAPLVYVWVAVEDSGGRRRGDVLGQEYTCRRMRTFMLRNLISGIIFIALLYLIAFDPYSVCLRSLLLCLKIGRFRAPCGVLHPTTDGSGQG